MEHSSPLFACPLFPAVYGSCPSPLEIAPEFTPSDAQTESNQTYPYEYMGN